MSASSIECTSSIACEDVDRPSAEELSSSAPSLSRKRLAARRLPPITLVTHPTLLPTETDSTVASLTPFSSHESLADDADIKRQRLDVPVSQPSGGCVFPEVLDGQSGSPCGSSERDDAQRVCANWSNINNTIVGGYQLVGAGKEFTAFHKETKVVKTCQLIDSDQYQKILKMRERLNEADKYWKYDDLDEMREFVLPSETEVCEDEYGRRFMFSPWQYGTLQRKMQAALCMLPELEVQPLFKQIVRGITFCHTIGVVVRDLKLRKFVFTDKDLTRLRLHDVFDLFICEELNNDGVRDRHSCPAYVAPEILVKGPAEYAGRPADVWALGVLLYVLLFRRYPFNDVTPQRLFSRILKARFCIPVDANVSYAARALIYGMLRKEPSERPTAKQLLHMPWISTTFEALSKQIKFWMAPVHFLRTGAVLQTPMVAELPLSLTPRLQLTSESLTTLSSSTGIAIPSTRRLYNREDAGDHVVPDVAASAASGQGHNPEAVRNVLGAVSGEHSERYIRDAWRALASGSLLSSELLSHTFARL
uniref:Tribbles 2 n=1 Tax=Ascaris suum TaxID=6253 RepID=F1KSU4_ASCSU